MARAVDVPFTKNSADHPRALQPAFERCATPLTIHGHRDLFYAVDARARWRTTWRTYHAGSPALLRASVVASREV